MSLGYMKVVYVGDKISKCIVFQDDFKVGYVDYIILLKLVM